MTDLLPYSFASAENFENKKSLCQLILRNGASVCPFFGGGGCEGGGIYL